MFDYDIYWVICGIVLIIAELLTPGVFLLWIGLAGIAIAGILQIYSISLGWQLFIFALLSTAIVILGRAFLMNKNKLSQKATLSSKAEALIGQELFLSEAISKGKGKIAIADSIWSVQGDDMPSGTKVRIEKVEGNALTVSKL